MEVLSLDGFNKNNGFGVGFKGVANAKVDDKNSYVQVEVINIICIF